MVCTWGSPLLEAEGQEWPIKQAGVHPAPVHGTATPTPQASPRADSPRGSGSEQSRGALLWRNSRKISWKKLNPNKKFHSTTSTEPLLWRALTSEDGPAPLGLLYNSKKYILNAVLFKVVLVWIYPQKGSQETPAGVWKSEICQGRQTKKKASFTQCLELYPAGDSGSQCKPPSQNYPK